VPELPQDDRLATAATNAPHAVAIACGLALVERIPELEAARASSPRKPIDHSGAHSLNHVP
jgi:hypothetical protein